MVEHVVERAADPERAAKAETERDHAHMLDARIGHQPLDALLAHDEQRADQQRDGAEDDEREAWKNPEVGAVSGDLEEAHDAEHRGVEQRTRQHR